MLHSAEKQIRLVSFGHLEDMLEQRRVVLELIPEDQTLDKPFPVLALTN